GHSRRRLYDSVWFFKLLVVPILRLVVTFLAGSPRGIRGTRLHLGGVVYLWPLLVPLRQPLAPWRLGFQRTSLLAPVDTAFARPHSSLLLCRRVGLSNHILAGFAEKGVALISICRPEGPKCLGR